jgi:outer membrane protein
MKIQSTLKRITQSGFALVMALTALTHAQAQTMPAQEVTLKDAVNYALQNKADAAKAKLDVENSEYQIEEVRSQALPTISIDAGLTYNPILQLTAIDASSFPGAPADAGVQLIPFGLKWASTAGVNLTQKLFDQSVFTGLKAARTTREFYQINAQLTEEQVIERVANAYYQVYIQKQNLAVLDSTYANTKEVRDIIKGQFDNGLARKIDLDRMNVNLNNISAQRQQVLNAVQQQENALKFYIGMPIGTPIALPDTQFEISTLASSELPDTTNRTEYLVLKKQEELYFYNKKAMQAAYYPTLSLTAGYNYIGQGPEFPWFAKPADGVYWSDFSSIGLNLHIPIFTGFGTRARVRQADIELKKTEQDLKDTKLALDLEYQNAVTQIDNSLTVIKNQRENVKLAQEVMDNTQNNYQQGLAPLTDLLDAENSLIEAQNNYNAAMLDYKLAEVQLIKAKGELQTLKN